MSVIKEQLGKVLALLRSDSAKRTYGVSLVFLVLWSGKKFLKFLKWRRQMIKELPGAQNPSLFLGDINELIASGGFGEEFFKRLHSKHGEFCRFFLGPTIMNVSLANPEHVLEMYKKTSSRANETYMFLSYLTKENLLFQHGGHVKALRLRYGKMISNPKQLRKVLDISFEVFGKSLVDTWYENSTQDVHKTIGPVIYDVMGRALFGGNWSESTVGNKIMNLHFYLVQNVNRWMFWPVNPWFMADFCKYEKNRHEWYELCWGLIEERRASIKADPKKWENDESALTLICTNVDEEGKPFFYKERAIATMCGFLNGAFDTTHATSYWMTFNLARYPDVQERVREEIYATIGSRTECSIEELRSMEYLDCFIKESMRLNNTVTVNQRVNYEQDITVGGKYTIPKGTNINIPGQVVMTNQQWFGKDADQFRPDRFLSSEPGSAEAKRHNLVFGSHNRMCIGETFARVELKCFLIKALSQFRISFKDPATADPTPYTEAGVNQPVNKSLFTMTQVNSREEKVSKNLAWWTPPGGVHKSLEKPAN